MTILPRFYVYILCRPSGKPFYVGKGSGKRVFKHDVEARSGCACHKCRVIRKIWQQNGDIVRYTVFTTNDEEEAYTYERELIAAYGRKTLTNATDGGIGGTGHIVSPEVRDFHRNARKSDWANPDYRARMTDMSRKMAADPEMRARLSASHTTRLSDPAEREKASQAQYKRYEDPAEHAKQSAVNHVRWADPAQRERLAERNRTSDMRAKLSAAKKAQWQDPEFRAKMIAARRRRTKANQ